ncbi:unnamed protein product [Lathyrus oleraceus]
MLWFGFQVAVRFTFWFWLHLHLKIRLTLKFSNYNLVHYLPILIARFILGNLLILTLTSGRDSRSYESMTCRFLSLTKDRVSIFSVQHMRMMSIVWYLRKLTSGYLIAINLLAQN